METKLDMEKVAFLFAQKSLQKENFINKLAEITCKNAGVTDWIAENQLGSMGIGAGIGGLLAGGQKYLEEQDREIEGETEEERNFRKKIDPLMRGIMGAAIGSGAGFLGHKALGVSNLLGRAEAASSAAAEKQKEEDKKLVAGYSGLGEAAKATGIGAGTLGVAGAGALSADALIANKNKTNNVINDAIDVAEGKFQTASGMSKEIGILRAHAEGLESEINRLEAMSTNLTLEEAKQLVKLKVELPQAERKLNATIAAELSPERAARATEELANLKSKSMNFIQLARNFRGNKLRTVARGAKVLSIPAALAAIMGGGNWYINSGRENEAQARIDALAARRN